MQVTLDLIRIDVLRRSRLRAELEAAYEEDLDEVFDVAAVRAALEQRLRSLESELHQVCTLGSADACLIRLQGCCIHILCAVCAAPC